MSIDVLFDYSMAACDNSAVCQAFDHQFLFFDWIQSVYPLQTLLFSTDAARTIKEFYQFEKHDPTNVTPSLLVKALSLCITVLPSVRIEWDDLDYDTIFIENIILSYCSNCGRQATAKGVGCKRVVYCGKLCQREDWRGHKTSCGSGKTN